jgi:uncharacterized paraquat-inducible protein A
MFKRIIECEECGNDATVYTEAKEEIAFCPFCGEVIVADTDMEDADEEDMDEDEDWPESGC